MSSSSSLLMGADDNDTEMLDRPLKSPLAIPELVRAVIGHVNEPTDLLSCACLNVLWNNEAMAKLYKGSLHDMKLRTPNIGYLNSLLTASPARFIKAMSYVDHLMILPERIEWKDVQPPGMKAPRRMGVRREMRVDRIPKPTCGETCRAFRNRTRCEYVLRPGDKSHRSIVIPFSLEDQNFNQSLICNLIFRTPLNFLLIDDTYCGMLLDELKSLQELTSLNMFLDLKALSIYHSNLFLNYDAFRGMLRFFDLEFFHLEQIARNRDRNLLATDILSTLKQQQNLKLLAMTTMHWPLCNDSGEFTQYHQVSFLDLRALYLENIDIGWRDFISGFTHLQMLSIRCWSQWKVPNFATELAEIFMRLPHLEVINIGVERDFRFINEGFRYAEMLLNIANSCPSLRKLSLATFTDDDAQSKISEEDFLSLLRSLPRIEWLAFDLKLRISGSKLQELVQQCPRLNILELKKTQLFLSFKSLVETLPFLRLQHMRLENIKLVQPWRFQHPESLEALVREWCRVFPLLVDAPCFTYSASTTGEGSENLSKEEGHAEYAENADVDLSNDQSFENDMSSDSEPDSDSEAIIYYFDSYILRKLQENIWRRMGYKEDEDTLHKAKYMWQANYEIKTFGWPVVLAAAFWNPKLYSSSS